MNDGMRIAHGKARTLPKQDYPLSAAREQSTIFFAGRKKNLWIEVSAHTAPPNPIQSPFIGNTCRF
ncbi:hypothetical protein [Burkholderia pseudomultivorans]|uniref:hypothetical protein n=1 Tax=Burkholderia pseudomultivorans TaxID=1207504 RepID=UPI0012D8777C|nr:hypothetical protein [Burkholderia pseudomultivorans]